MKTIMWLVGYVQRSFERYLLYLTDLHYVIAIIGMQYIIG